MSRSQIVRQVVMDKVTCVNGTKYSDVVSFRMCTGTAKLIIISTAGTLAISQQCCEDYDPGNPAAATWYDPIDIIAGALGVVKAAQTVTAGVDVTFTPVMTEWIRFKVIESSASTVVTLKLSFRVEV